MSMWNFFSRKAKKPGIVMLASGMVKKEERRIDNAIDALWRDIQASINPVLTPEQKIEKECENIRKEIERQKRIRPSTVEKKMSDINLESEMFPKSFDLPGFRISEHHWKQGRTMTLSDDLSLFNLVMQRNLRTVEDLTKLDDQSREMILSRVWDKPTYLKLIKVCQEAQRDAPPQENITRHQFISNRMHKIFNP